MRPARCKATGAADPARLARRLLRRLAEPDAFMTALDIDDAWGVFLQGAGTARPVMTVPAALANQLVSVGLVAAAAKGQARYRLTPEGKAFLRRAAAPDQPFGAQHRVVGRRLIVADDGSGQQALTVNLAESPLAWLASRKGVDGAPLIGPALLEAGERLRADYTRAQLLPRVTVDWERPMAGGGTGVDSQLSLTETAMAARRRVGAALEAVGPELGDILLVVCCFLKGLEEAERDMRWPARSGKIVLRIALERLARHYGILRGESTPKLRAWVDAGAA